MVIRSDTRRCVCARAGAFTAARWDVVAVVGLLLGGVALVNSLGFPLTRDEIWHWPAALLRPPCRRHCIHKWHSKL